MKKFRFKFFIALVLILFFCKSSEAKKDDVNFPTLYLEQAIKHQKEGEIEAAITALNNSLNLNPSYLPAIIQLGELEIEQGKNELAISTLLRSANIAPDDALVHVLLGNAYFENMQLDHAISHYKTAAMLEPDNTLIRANLGNACLVSGDIKCTIENLGKVVLAYPFQLRARTSLGVAYHSKKDYALAQEQYKFVLEYEPENQNLWYNQAKTNIALGEYEAAKNNLDKAIAIDNMVTEILLDRGLANYKLNKLEEAEKDYQEALKLDPQNPSVPIEYASFLWKTGAYQKAAEQYKKALELQPDDKDLITNQAFLLQLSDKKNEAINAWQKVLKNDRKNQVAIFNLAQIYQDKLDFASAIPLYKQLIEIKEDDIEAKSRLAFCLQKTRDFPQAKFLYESLLKEIPNDPVIPYNLGVLLNEEKNYQESTTYFKKAIDLGFTPLQKVHQALTESYINLHDTLNIKSSYKNWLDLDKDNIDARIAYAQFLSKIGDSQEAVDQYRVAATLDKTSKSRYKLAQFLLEKKDLYGAVGQLQEYLKNIPNDSNALILLANAFKELGINEQAINTYKKVLSLQAENQIAYFNLGLLLVQEKKYEEAQNYLLKSIELNEKYAPAYYALGIAYLSNKDKIKAKELFEKYLQIDPEGEFKEIVLTKLKEIDSPETNKPA